MTRLIRAAWLVYLGGVLLVPRGMRWVPAAALALLAPAVVRDPTVLLDMAVFASQEPARPVWLIAPVVPAYLAGVGADAGKKVGSIDKRHVTSYSS